MEAKKSRKFIMMLITVAILIFVAVLYLNNHLDSKQKNNQAKIEKDELVLIAGAKQSYISSNKPVLSEDDIYTGKKDADLKIFVYEDYGDIFSAELDKSLIKVREDFGDDVLIIYRPFNIKHDTVSVNNALALNCANEQGKAESWRQYNFKAILNNNISVEDIDNLKLNKNDFKDCLSDQSRKERVKEIMSQAISYSVYGAPTIFVGDEMIVGARPYLAFTDSNGDEIEGLKQVIERQLK